VRQEGLSSPGGEAYFWFGHVNYKWLGLLNHIVKNPDELYLHATVGADLYYPEVQVPYPNDFNNKWIFYALIYKDGRLKFYINGKLIASKKIKVDYFSQYAALGRHWWFYDNEERTSARFTGAFDEVKIYKRALTEEELNSKCKTYIDYPNFINTDRLVFVENAHKADSAIRLTGNQLQERGAVWFDTPVYVDDNFWTEFSFKFTDGNDFSNSEGSEPGADGIAFVIQNQGNHAIGVWGGDIGYGMLNNAVAIEYDTYYNGRNQIVDYFDPNGNHIALQVAHNGIIKAEHSPDYKLAIDTSIIKMKNGLVYHSRIEYNHQQKNLKVYLSKDNVFTVPVIDYSPIDLTDYINSSDNSAYIGFTSATGSASERHLLLNWKFCSQATPMTEVKVIHTHKETAVVPNPASDYISLNIENSIGDIASIEITNYIGIKYLSLNRNELTGKYNGNTLIINVSQLPKGLYFVKINFDKNVLLKKFIKN
jgi:hypothetical protein